MNRSVSLTKGSDRMNLLAARGSSTQPGDVHNERSSHELENAADRPAGRPGSSSSGAEAFGTPSAPGSRSVNFASSPSRSAAAIPAMSETARRRASGSRAKGWGGIRRAGRRRGPGVDRPFPSSAQRARRSEPVSQAAWRTITRPSWRGVATAPGLTVGVGGEPVTSSVCRGNGPLQHQPLSDEVDGAMVVPGAVDVARSWRLSTRLSSETRPPLWSTATSARKAMSFMQPRTLRSEVLAMTSSSLPKSPNVAGGSCSSRSSRSTSAETSSRVDRSWPTRTSGSKTLNNVAA